MTDEEKEAALEKLLIPIKELYSEITTRGNKFCYPFIYTDADGDYLSYITQLIEAFVERVKELDETSVLILNKAFENLPEDKKTKKNFDFIRDLDALSQLVLDVLKDCYKCYPDDAFQKLKSFFEADDYFYLKMLPQLSIDNQCKLYRIYNCICIKGHNKDLASRMQMTDVKTITREQLRQSIVYKNGNYSIDFRQLNVIDDNSFRDIDVKMEVG